LEVSGIDQGLANHVELVMPREDLDLLFASRAFVLLHLLGVVLNDIG
jgi:hypothetical protein